MRGYNAFFLVAGKGESNVSELNAFDVALLDAGVGDLNLMKMSSIIPPNVRLIEPIKLPAGSLVPVAYAAITSSVRGEKLVAAIGVGIPEDPQEAGVIMEYEAPGVSKSEAEKIVEEMVREAFTYRKRSLREVRVIAIEHTVEKFGAAFAGAVLCEV